MPLKEFVETARREIDSSAEIGYGKKDYPEDMPMDRKVDISLLKKDAGFSPMVAFDKGVRRTAKWYKENCL